MNLQHPRPDLGPSGIVRGHLPCLVELEQFGGRGVVDLFGLKNGGRALAASDEHYGSMHNLNLPGRGVNMGDGWETARRRGPGNDWVVVALGKPGVVDRVEVDTAYFKGNYPDQCSLQAASIPGGSIEAIAAQSLYWENLMPKQHLQADRLHHFDEQINSDLGAVSHVRFCIYPDGGVARLRLWGTVQL